MKVDSNESFRQLSLTIINSKQMRMRVLKLSPTLMTNLSSFRVDESARELKGVH